MEDLLIIEAGKKKNLKPVKVPGAKNAVLPMIASSILIPSEVTINNVPLIDDVKNMLAILKFLGAHFSWKGNSLELDCSQINKAKVPRYLVKKLRASFLTFGPLLVKKGKSETMAPGGCPIGKRSLDIHLNGLNKFGANIIFKKNKITGILSRPKPFSYELRFPSVGATEHLLSVASAVEGTSVIRNCAIEPEVLDLVTFLKKAGADIKQKGSKFIINGKRDLVSVEHTLIPDRIVAATWISAAVVTRSNIQIKNISPDFLSSFLSILTSTGVDIKKGKNSLYINAKNELRPFHIRTGPYPEFPTDIQPFMAVIACTISGESTIEENIFEDRFGYAKELKKMGANIKKKGRKLFIKGGFTLHGTDVSGTDLRGTAAIALASLLTEEKTILKGKKYLDRGYEKFEEILKAFGCSTIIK